MSRKTVLVCGSDGYIAHALVLRLLKNGYKVVGIDDLRRRVAVHGIMKSYSATKIENCWERQQKFKEIGDFVFYHNSIEKRYDNLKEVFLLHKPDIIVNLAQQPSAPFSLKSRLLAENTTVGNIIGTLNILYAMREVCPESSLIQIGSMGEYNPAVGIDIPEGKFDFEMNGKLIKDAIFPRAPGSFYHASKVASTYYLDCASKWWGLGITDIMQGVVFGNWTPEIEETGLQTRLDSDEAFGTVVNRFIIQALLGEPLTIYGDGEHRRGFLSLNDSVQCLMLAIENEPKYGEYRTWNQLDTTYSIKEVAQEVAEAAVEFDETNIVEFSYIESPRVEDTSDFYYKPIVEKLKKLGFKPTRSIKDEALYLFNILNIDEILSLGADMIPNIKWK